MALLMGYNLLFPTELRLYLYYILTKKTRKTMNIRNVSEMLFYFTTNEIFASKHDTAALKVKKGHFKSTILVLYNLVVSFITAKA